MKRTDIQTGVIYAWSSQNDIYDPYTTVLPVVVLDTETLWDMTTSRFGYRHPEATDSLVKPTASRREDSDTGLLAVRCKDPSPTQPWLQELALVTKDDVVARTYGDGTHLNRGHFEITTVMGRQLKGDYYQIMAKITEAARARRERAEAAEYNQAARYNRLDAVTRALGRVDVTAVIREERLVLDLDSAERLVDLLGDSGAKPASAT